MEIPNSIQIVAIISEVVFIIYFLWRFYGKLLNKYEPDIQDMDAEMENVCAELAEVKSKQNVFRQEIFEYMDGILTPLNKRMNQRLRREIDLKDNETSDSTQSRRGILGYKKKKV